LRILLTHALLLFFVVICYVPSAARAAGEFRSYVVSSSDYRRVPQRPEMLLSSGWDHWILMPWRYRWGRGYDLELALLLREAGYNGGVCDVDPDAGGVAAIHSRAGLRWYLDHAAGKGDLFLRKKHTGKKARLRYERPNSLADPATVRRLRGGLREALTHARSHGMRAAYALDDEPSWTSYTNPAKWDNGSFSLAGYTRWLEERYGRREALKAEWDDSAKELVEWAHWKAGESPSVGFIRRMANPDDFQTLYKKPLSEWNLAPWCDGLSYMDSQFADLIGDLVELSNSIDPETPCGIVGGQAPAPYGGYDYAKLMRKVQFLGAYDIGGSMEIIRSFNPGNMIPAVRTLFFPPGAPSAEWFCWYYLVHGDRGVIAWADGWFSKKVPADRVLSFGRTVEEISKTSRILLGATWIHDGVALYYSHPSIQVSWFIDCAPHGRTWINRTGMNNRFASSVGTAWAWQKLLEDYRVQYDWFSYARLLEEGIDPDEYKVLILPRTLCLSEEEARAIRKYVGDGGHVIADHMTGIFDEHGKARGDGSGILDPLFGIEDRPVCMTGTLFDGRSLTEIDAEKYYDRQNFLRAGAGIWPDCERARGLVVAQRDLSSFARGTTGRGWACHLNVSVMEYLLVREEHYRECAAYAAPVLELLEEAGVRPWVRLSIGGEEPEATEATYWRKNGRTIVCIVKNPLRLSSVSTDPAVPGAGEQEIPLTISFDKPLGDVRDELSGRSLGDGKSFTVPWKMNKAAIVSFKH